MRCGAPLRPDLSLPPSRFAVAGVVLFDDRLEGLEDLREVRARATGRHRGSIATGLLSFPCGFFFAACQFFFGDLSILTVPSRHADAYDLAPFRMR